MLLRITAIDEFKGLWRGLDRHTTGLQLLADVVDYGEQFQQVLGPLESQPLTYEVLQALNRSPARMNDAPLEITKAGKLVGEIEVADAALAKPLTEKLLKWVNEEVPRRDLHPLLIAAVFMAVFLQTKPFAENNMATACFVVMLIMLKSGYPYAPYVPLNALAEQRAEEMFKALAANQRSIEAGSPQWAEWVSVFADMLQEQSEILTGRLYAKEAEMKHLPKLSAKIMALFKYHKRLQMKEIEKLTNGRRPTLKLRLGELVEAGYLKRYGAGRSTWYALT